jgi:hypothetical protein
LRERDQYTASPIRKVCSKASWFIHAIIKTSPLEASCAMTATKPSSFQVIRSSHGPDFNRGFDNLSFKEFPVARFIAKDNSLF